MQRRESSKLRYIRILVGITAAFSIGACQQGFEASMDPLPDDPTEEVYDPTLNKPETDALAAQFSEPTYTANEQTTTASFSSPIQIAGSWSQICVGSIYALGLKGDGSLFAWGNNQYGQLGQSDLTMRSSPVQIAGVWKRIATTNNSAYGFKK
jgi:alpha-tubulin suppressor-like RCC1 family protein